MTDNSGYPHDIPSQSALFISAFFDELARCGVSDVVASPGSRSTPLAMVAHTSSMRLVIDIDERSAAFLALGLAKASGHPVVLLCTSGTAVANFYPAILEARSSRVPLIVLSADRPPRLHGLGAVQTCDQQKIFGDQVLYYQQMPLPGASPAEIAFARQMALEVFAKAAGFQGSLAEDGRPFYGCISNAGPVHLNFPFDEPLKPNLAVEGLFSRGRRAYSLQERSPLLPVSTKPGREAIEEVVRLMEGRRTMVLCGEGSFANAEEARRLLDWAQRYRLPLLADPLSGLRCYTDDLVIDNYDMLFGNAEALGFDVLIRFGRYPVSKSCFT
ncbi:MAG: 2-succinyl-5-enolpyruvyl-6-hydroxy-3-cyclohexene-1-carboxylic-acid synthase, partial [Eggerthellaceae bacterium]|nr:2-succinyl-5-enolpyruvyl-6-hydroxy-3-cyclohexene-1-carboxylic-acid synthase [Eggerthellaceae bacterium]